MGWKIIRDGKNRENSPIVHIGATWTVIEAGANANQGLQCPLSLWG